MPRQERLVESQERFRRANQRLHERINSVTRDGQVIPFICECPEDTCTAPVPLTLEEYAGVRGDDSHFVIAPGHPIIDGEDVLTENERYSVVEKSLA